METNLYCQSHFILVFFQPISMTKRKYFFFLIGALAIITSCQETVSRGGISVSNPAELDKAITESKPGNVIIMANGTWDDVQIKLYGKGTKAKPITLRAETPGEVILEGKSNLSIGGEHLIVDGLHFQNGSTPSRSVIQFLINQDTLAFHSRVTNCVVKDYNQAQKDRQDWWVLFKGRHNQLDHCYLAGKSNKGPTIRVDIAGNQSINNYHRINNNHFGRRPPKGGPSAETIQIGDSYTSISPSYTDVSNNLFDRCDGEVEVISSKTNFNVFRNNVFYKSEGSLVTRHGNYCTVDGNYFIGDDHSNNAGGIRLIGTGHWVTNNYFYKIKGEIFRSPLAVMNGIKKSPLNRYIQVTDVVVAHNTWVDCKSPWQFGVGSNIDQKDVLPASEIRSEVPIRTLVANNVIYNTKGDPKPVFRHDAIDKITFKNNVINNQKVSFTGLEGLDKMAFKMTELEENIWVPGESLSDVEVHAGFDFENIATDLFGNSRKDNNTVGAIKGSRADGTSIMDLDQYGPTWFNATPKETTPNTYSVATSEEFITTLAKASDGDIVTLSADRIELSTPLRIDREVTIRSKDGANKTTIVYSGPAATPAFEMNPKGKLTLQSVILKGSGKNYAFASLKENMSSLYNLNVIESEISNFDFVLKAYKHSFSEYIQFTSSIIKNCANGIELSTEDADRGEYNAENVFIRNCEFQYIDKNVIDYYRGGYDESTVGGNLIVDGCSFTNSGAREENKTLINTYGIINVNITNNTFTNNSVQLVARLWGAKNNAAAGNNVKNSGKIITEQNLPLKLFY